MASVTPPLPTLLHLTASPCYGGSERQMLELGRELRSDYRSVYATFREEERCWEFVRQAEEQGFEVVGLKHDTPRVLAAYRELVDVVRHTQADVLLCHSYKPNILGRIAARELGIPVIAVSHGWTGESLRVRAFDWLDRVNLRWMDRVVCVSEGQATKARRYGVPADKVIAICDAVRAERFDAPDPSYRERLEGLFSRKPAVIVGAAGRLSPEKGYRFLVEAAAVVRNRHPQVSFVLFGDGPLRNELTSQIAALGLQDTFLLPGFCHDIDRYYPQFDIFVLPSFTEGLPNVVLESFAAGVPVVATAVGGTPELVVNGVNGYLVPPGQATPLAECIGQLAGDPQQRAQMGAHGRQRVRDQFSFQVQAAAYKVVLNSLLAADRNGLPKASQVS